MYLGLLGKIQMQNPAALSIGSENQIPKILMQFPSMETFSYQSCQSISLYFLNLLHGLLRSCQTENMSLWLRFIADSKIDTEFVLQFASLWCDFIGISSKAKAKMDAYSLKIAKNVAFPPIFVRLKFLCLVTLFDRKLQGFRTSPKLTIFGILMNFCTLKM